MKQYKLDSRSIALLVGFSSLFFSSAIFAVGCTSSETPPPVENTVSGLSELEEVLKSSIEDKTIHGYAFSIYDEDDQVIFTSEDGVYRLEDQDPITANTSVKTRIASGTKWVTSTLTLRPGTAKLAQKHLKILSDFIKS